MEIKYQLSKFERVSILTFAFLAFALFAIGIAGEAIQSYNASVVRHHNEIARVAGVKNIVSFSGGPYNSIPLFNLITFPVLLALMRPGKYLISTALTLLYSVFLIISVVGRLDGRDGFGMENFFTDPWLELWMKTSFIDYFAGGVIAILLIWQCSILWRLVLAGRRDLVLE